MATLATWGAFVAVVAGATSLWSARGRSLLAAMIAWLVGGVLGVRRDHVVSAMRRAGVGRPEQVARRMYRVLAVNLLEVLTLAFGPGLLRRVVLPRELDVLRAQGAGAVIVTAHTGNWDLVACAVAERAPLTVVTRHLKVGVLDWLWQALRARRGVWLVAEGAATAAARVALRRGGLVAMMADQVPLRRRAVIEVDFLGAPAPVDIAPALVAMRSRRPIIAVFARRDARGLHHCEIVGRFEPPVRPSRAWAEATMREVTRRLESFVLEHPEQWLWMHRRWLSFQARAPGDQGRGPGGPRTRARFWWADERRGGIGTS